MSDFVSIRPSTGPANSSTQTTISLIKNNTGTAAKTATLTVSDTSTEGATPKTCTITILGAVESFMFNPKSYNAGSSDTSVAGGITGKSNRATLVFVKPSSSDAYQLPSSITISSSESKSRTIVGSEGMTQGGLPKVTFSGITEGEKAEYDFTCNLSFEANGTTSRKTYTMLAYGNKEETLDTITVTHSGSSAYIQLDHDTITLPATIGTEGAEVNLAVMANVPWKAEIVDN